MYKEVVFIRDLTDVILGVAKIIKIEGKLATRKWEDKEGVTRYTTEITCFVLEFLDAKGGDDQGARPAPVQTSDASLDEIPF